MEFKAQPIDWDAKDMELNSGSIDCIWNGFTINGREDKYTWTKPYVNNSQVFVVRKDSGITKFEDLKGKIVSVQTDSSAQEALNDEKNAAIKKSLKEVVTCKEYNTAFMDLQSGAIDAIAMDVKVLCDPEHEPDRQEAKRVEQNIQQQGKFITEVLNHLLELSVNATRKEADYDE